MLRRKASAPLPEDAIDQELLEGVDAGFSWSVLLRSVSCSPEEAEQRLARLLHEGYLDGWLGEDPARMPRSTLSGTLPRTTSAGTMSRSTLAGVGPASLPPNAQPASSRTSGLRPPIDASATPVMTRPPAAPSAPTSSGVQSAPPRPLSASEALLRELAARRGGVVRPEPEHVRLRGSQPPFASQRPSPPGASQRPGPPGASVPPDPYGRGGQSGLPSLIETLSQGEGLQRWAAGRLREALAEEQAGADLQAVAILQVVLAQLEDPRIRAERDRLKNKAQTAASGVHRSAAQAAQKALNHRLAVDHWRKVLEAHPNDVEAALHAALCYLNLGELKQCGAYARRAAELAPNNVNAHKLLLRFFEKSGMETSANKEREILRKLGALK